MPAFISTLSQTDLVDLTDLTKLRKSFARCAGAFEDAIKEVKPEFGAYMSYSFYLEMGTRKMPARPHIRPAVEKNAQVIVEGVLDYLLDYLSRSFASTSGTSAMQDKQAYERAWLRMLNGPVRQTAVELSTELKIYEYGFHRRSIYGYVAERTPAEIAAQQAQAMADRRGRNYRAKRGRK